MKLKQVVKAVFLMGLAAAPAVAAAASNDGQMDSMKAQIAKMEAALNQNQNGLNLPSDGWFNRIKLSGEVNAQAAAANRSPVDFAQKNYVSSLYLNNANLYVDAVVNDWTTAHIGLVYGSDAPSFVRIPANVSTNLTSSESTANSTTQTLNEAYATIGCLTRSPVYFRAGLQNVQFGDYVPYQDLTKSYTQLLSETQAAAATLGFADGSGINATVAWFNGIGKNNNNGTINEDTGAPENSTTPQERAQNFTASLGYDNVYGESAYNIGVQYIRNMADVNYIASGLGLQNGYHTSVSGLAANAGVKYNAIDVSAKYVSALTKFSPLDMITLSNGSLQGASPSAWGVDAGYSFQTLAHNSRVGLGYQGTNQAQAVGGSTTAENGSGGIGLPKTRLLVNYSVNVSKCTDLGFEVYNDRDYNYSQAADSGANATTATVRLAVKFA